jgi:uncharacterized protein DUF1353
MPFLSDLVVKDVGEFDWKVMSPLRYEGGTQCFEIPAGAQTDFASVPALFQWLIPRSGRYTKAAVLHDHLWRTPIDGVSQGDADAIFRRCMGNEERSRCRLLSPHPWEFSKPGRSLRSARHP